MHTPAAAGTPHRAEAGAVTLDTSYILGYHGFIYASGRLSRGVTARPPAALLLSADYAAFELRLAPGPCLRLNAAVVAPRVARSIEAQGVPLLSFNVMPSHPAFHAFSALHRTRVMALDRHAFAPLDADFARVLRGEHALERADALFDQVMAEALRQVPPVAAPDPRALEMIRMLDEDPTLGPDALARRCGRSQQMVSQLISAALGMSMRDYMSWLKQRRLLDQLFTPKSLTEVALNAGFGDSPQFSRAFQRWYGQSPSFSRNPKQVRVFVPGARYPAETPGRPSPGGQSLA